MTAINPTIVILWEHELIAAAKALAPFAKGSSLPEPTDADCLAMLRACFAALYSPELASGECAVTVMCCKTLLATSPKEK